MITQLKLLLQYDMSAYFIISIRGAFVAAQLALAGLAAFASDEGATLDSHRRPGYHTRATQAGAKHSSTPSAREEQLLETALQELRGGNASLAGVTLEELVRLFPNEPAYDHLLKLVRRQASLQAWYRYQERPTTNAGQPPPAIEPASPQERAVHSLRTQSWMQYALPY